MTHSLKEISPIAVKICGLTSISDIKMAASIGARYAGFVFFEKSPRALTFEVYVRVVRRPDVVCRVYRRRL